MAKKTSQNITQSVDAQDLNSTTIISTKKLSEDLLAPELETDDLDFSISKETVDSKRFDIDIIDPRSGIHENI